MTVEKLLMYYAPNYINYNDRLMLIDVVQKITKIKCKELLLLVAEDMNNGSWYVNEYRVLEDFDLDEFIV